MLKIFLGLLFLLQTVSYTSGGIYDFPDEGIFYNHTNTYQTKIVNTPIFRSIPNTNFHHIVLVSKNKELNDKGLYIFDFSQRAKMNPFNILKLILGCSVPSIIRIIHFPNVNETTIIDDWYNRTKIPHDFRKTLKQLNNERVESSCPFSLFSLFESSDYKNDDNLDKIITEYNKPFNLYTNNCRHFSKFFVSNINKF